MRKDRLLKSIRNELAKQPKLAYQVAALGNSIVRALALHASSGESEILPLLAAFREHIKAQNLENLLDHQIEYATDIVNSEANLIFEDMFKLVSLCDEIEALRQIGLETFSTDYAEFQNSVRGRFKQERKNANAAAGCLCEPWKKGWWHYMEVLGKKRQS